MAEGTQTKNTMTDNIERGAGEEKLQKNSFEYENEARNIRQDFYKHYDINQSNAYETGYYDACIKRSVEIRQLEDQIKEKDQEIERLKRVNDDVIKTIEYSKG